MQSVIIMFLVIIGSLVAMGSVMLIPTSEFSKKSKKPIDKQK